MPTLTKIQRNLRDYKRAMAEHSSIASLVGWFGRELGVGKPRMQILLGYDPAESKQLAGRSVEELAAEQPEQALWLAELFKELFHRVSYDVEYLKAMLHPPPIGLNPTSEMSFPSGAIPRFRCAPVDQASVLLAEIARGGSQVFDRLIEYLRLPMKEETQVPNGAG